MKKTPWASDDRLNALSKAEIGADLAARVAHQLVSDDGKKGIWNSHRDYCGHGLVYNDGKICLVTVTDGDPLYGALLLDWEQPEAFVKWLSRQSDYTLSGADRSEPALFTKSKFSLNNQRLTKAKLEHYLR